tara:strand:- start:552 stop:869 length:318 start_codon:yes stop_codon:yes gene_type:complete
MPHLPDLSLTQITFLAYLAKLQKDGEPVQAADLRAAVRPDFDVARGAQFYQVMNRLDKRGLVDKFETTTPGTDALPAVTYLLTDGGTEAVADFCTWSKIMTRLAC